MSATFFHRLGAMIILLWLAVGLAACSNFVKGGDNRHNQPLPGAVVQGLRNMGSAPDQGMVVRIFKEEKTLEIWKKTANGTYKFFKNYEICAFSGDLGPKFKEGDRQSPEGFYTITPGLMNPKSNYYLAFNTGFPNKFDRAHGRTGSDLMVHGDCSSRGCYAMTDEGIAEIYALARETFKGNASFQLQIFPFRMTPANLARHASSQHFAFWKDIKEGYDYFETTKTPPVWDVCEMQYIFNPVTTGAPIAAAGACPPTTPNAAVTARQQADDAALANQAQAIQQAAAREEANVLAMQQREQAIGGFFSGIGNMFGATGGNAGQDPNIAPVISGKPATMPTPATQRP